ncbi:MAG: DUF2089 family protein [Gimesia sp.]
MKRIEFKESLQYIASETGQVPHQSPRNKHPLSTLDQENLEFVLQLVLASGSLKDLARYYGISYPTVRSRLDKLITRLQVIIEGREADDMTELLANLVEEGQLASTAAQSILEVHRKNPK